MLRRLIENKLVILLELSFEVYRITTMKVISFAWMNEEDCCILFHFIFFLVYEKQQKNRFQFHKIQMFFFIFLEKDEPFFQLAYKIKSSSIRLGCIPHPYRITCPMKLVFCLIVKGLSL